MRRPDAQASGSSGKYSEYPGASDLESPEFMPSFLGSITLEQFPYFSASLFSYVVIGLL